MSVIRPASADGRAFTSYLASCVLDSTLASHHQRYGPQYRNWLQNNSSVAYNESRKMNVCFARPCYLIPNPITNSPTMINPNDPQTWPKK